MDKQIRELATEILQEFTNCYSEADEDCLVKMIRKYISENAVVLTEEELDKKLEPFRLEIIALSQELVETSQKLMKERKETEEKIFEELYTWLRLEEISKYGFVTIQKFDFLRKFRDLHKKLELDEIAKEITEGKI